MRDSSPSRPASTRPGTVPLASSPSALDLVKSLLNDIPRMIGERVQLLVLELKRARKALVVIAALVVTAALLLLTAWFVFWGALIAALIEAGLAWGWAVLLVLIVSIGVAVVALLRAKSLGRFLALPATMRHLTLAKHDPGLAQRAPFTSSSGGGANAGTPAATAGFAPGTGPTTRATSSAPFPAPASASAVSASASAPVTPSGSPALRPPSAAPSPSPPAPSSTSAKGPTP